MPSKRNYKKEYRNYHGKPSQIKRRSNRNKARRKISCPKGKDVGHKDGNPNNNARSNLKCVTKRSNRSYARTKTAGKKNRRS